MTTIKKIIFDLHGIIVNNNIYLLWSSDLTTSVNGLTFWKIHWLTFLARVKAEDW